MFVKTAFTKRVWYAVIMQLEQHEQHVASLRHMLAELMVKQSGPTLTKAQRRAHKQGIEALKAAVDAMTMQVYA